MHTTFFLHLIQRRKPSVLFVDEFYMNDAALSLIDEAGTVFRSAAREDRQEFLNEIRNFEPKVIVSEYAKIGMDEIKEASKTLVGIVVWGIGYDHIDIKAASENGIYVANTAGSNSESVAEHVMGMVLRFSRRIEDLDEFVRNGLWEKREETGLPKQLMPHELYGKTIGIIGLGAIGQRVARIAAGFGMKVIGHDRSFTQNAAEDIGVKLCGLDQVLSNSDFVTLHVPLTDATRALIGENELSKMKRTAYLINTSRGAVVNENSLIDALRANRIAGAGLDVFEEEPLRSGSPLLEMQNVILTPHCAGNSKEAMDSTALVVSHEVVRMLCGKPPSNWVNKALMT